MYVGAALATFSSKSEKFKNQGKKPEVVIILLLEQALHFEGILFQNKTHYVVT